MFLDMRDSAKGITVAAVAAAVGLAPCVFPETGSVFGTAVETIARAASPEGTGTPEAIGALFLERELVIADEIEAIPGAVTRAKVEKIVRSNVAKTFQAAANDPQSRMIFSPSSGKLKITTGSDAGRASILEVNLYKVSHDLTGSLMACLELRVADFKTCTQAAMLVAPGVIKKEMGPAATARAK